jgi:uncharacterized protein (DUF1800 family)
MGVGPFEPQEEVAAVPREEWIPATAIAKPCHPKRWRGPLCAASAVLLAACGGGGEQAGDTGATTSTTSAAPGATASAQGERAQALSATASSKTGDPFAGLSLAPDAAQVDATRLAQQASFGPTRDLINQIRGTGPAAWIANQMTLKQSEYTSGAGDEASRNDMPEFWCDRPDQINNENCWRDYFAADGLVWDFYRNAIEKPDQLRQRTALALQQIFVISNNAVYGTYGFRYYHNMLLNNAFGNYRDLLRKVSLAPSMGQYLNNVNNDKALPNENFARELLQLFSIGTCKLQANGNLVGGACKPTYDNEMVRNYAYALTGWTYPEGGSNFYGCYPEGANCEYLDGNMVSAPLLRDNSRRPLLSGVVVPSNASASKALDLVLDSLMNHPNIGPSVAKRMIQHFVGSNPKPEYVSRVAQAFNDGRFASGGKTFGTGTKGDMAATVAAILLDAEARGSNWDAKRGGHLREPIQAFTGAIRALNGYTDGGVFTYWWGPTLRQPVFWPPSVFNFYKPDYPVAGTDLVGPEFNIHNSNTALERLNYLTYLLEWNGSDPDPNQPNAIGTRVDLTRYLSMANDPERLIDGLSVLTVGRKLDDGPRQKVLKAVKWWTPQTDSANWQSRRVRTAAYLVLGSPDYQVQR